MNQHGKAGTGPGSGSDDPLGKLNPLANSYWDGSWMIHGRALRVADEWKSTNQRAGERRGGRTAATPLLADRGSGEQKVGRAA